MREVLFSAGWGTKEAENVFSHTAGGLMKSEEIISLASKWQNVTKQRFY
jgi:hypothetical protein